MIVKIVQINLYKKFYGELTGKDGLKGIKKFGWIIKIALLLSKKIYNIVN